MIVEGKYSFPFTITLPDWLPQSVLCFNTPDPKKPMFLNTFKIRYNLIAVIEGTAEGEPLMQGGPPGGVPPPQRRGTIQKIVKKGPEGEQTAGD